MRAVVAGVLALIAIGYSVVVIAGRQVLGLSDVELVALGSALLGIAVIVEATR